MTNRAFSLSCVGNSTKGLSPDLLLLGNKQVGFHNVIHTCTCISETAYLIHVLFTLVNRKSPASDDHMMYTAYEVEK